MLHESSLLYYEYQWKGVILSNITWHGNHSTNNVLLQFKFDQNVPLLLLSISPIQSTTGGVPCTKLFVSSCFECQSEKNETIHEIGPWNRDWGIISNKVCELSLVDDENNLQKYVQRRIKAVELLSGAQGNKFKFLLWNGYCDYTSLQTYPQSHCTSLHSHVIDIKRVMTSLRKATSPEFILCSPLWLPHSVLVGWSSVRKGFRMHVHDFDSVKMPNTYGCRITYSWFCCNAGMIVSLCTVPRCQVGFRSCLMFLHWGYLEYIVASMNCQKY